MCQSLIEQAYNFLAGKGPDWWAAFGTCVGAVGAIAATGVAWKQLGNLNDSQRTSNLTALIQIEIELTNRKKDFDKAGFEILENVDRLKKLSKKDKLKELKVLESKHKIAAENYLNIFDRLCVIIINKDLPLVDWEDDYREQLNDVTKTMTKYFGQDYLEKYYKNILKVNNMWKNSRSPVRI